MLLDGRFRLTERLESEPGEEVWHAVDELAGRPVVVRLLPTTEDDTAFGTRFAINVDMLMRVGVPGFAEILGRGVRSEPAGVYLVAAAVPGEPLSRILQREGPLPVGRTMSLVAQCADALAAAHAAGIACRGLRPGGVLVGPDDTVTLTDLWAGMVRPRDLSASSLLRVAHYLAPEQAMGLTASAETDVYTLGVVTYACLSGGPPFDAENPLEVAVRHVRDTPLPLAQSIPAPVRALVSAALAKQPGDRPSAARFAAEARRLSRPA